MKMTRSKKFRQALLAIMVCVITTEIVVAIHETGHIIESRGAWSEVCIVGWSNVSQSTAWTKFTRETPNNIDTLPSYAADIVLGCCLSFLLTRYVLCPEIDGCLGECRGGKKKEVK